MIFGFTESSSKVGAADTQMWEIRLHKGTGKFVTEGHTNKITGSVSNRLYLIPLALLKYFMRVGNLFFLAISLIMLIEPDYSPYLRWITIFPVGIFALVFVGKAIYIEHLRVKELQRVNKRDLPDQSKGDEKESTKKLWQDLKPGDLIRLNNGDVCPADILLTDSKLTRNGMKICWVDTQGVDGFTNYEQKRAAESMKNVNSSKEFTGKITYEPPNHNYKTFKGFLKLKKSFYKEQLGIENFILRGSVIKDVDYIEGVCLYTGNDAKVMQKVDFNKGTLSYYERMADKFFIFGIFLVFLMTVLSTVVFLSNDSDPQVIQSGEELRWLRIFDFFVLYSPYVPISLYGIYDIVLIIKAKTVQRDWKLKHTKTSGDQTPETNSINTKGHQIKVIDPNILPNLGQIDYCFFDKSGTLTSANYKLKSVYIPAKSDSQDTAKIYKIDHDYLKNNIKGRLEQRNENRNKLTTRVLDDQEPSNSLMNIPGMQHTPVDKNQNGFDFAKKDSERDTATNPNGDNTNKQVGSIGENMADNQGDGSVQQSMTDIDEGFEQATFLKQLQRESTFPALKEIQMSAQKSARDSNGDGTSRDDKTITPKSVSININKASGQDRKSMFKNQQTGTLSANMGKTIAEKSTIFDEKNILVAEDFIIDYTMGKKDNKVERLLHSLALCHEARTDQQKNYLTPYRADVAILQFTEMCGVKFLRTSKTEPPDEYVVEIDGKEKSFRIVGLNNFSYERKRSSVVFQKGQGEYMITVKGAPEGMKPLLNMTTEESVAFDSAVSLKQKQGLKPIVIAEKYLTKEEKREYEEKYNSLKQNIVFQGNELEELSKKFETNLSLVGVIGLQDHVREQATETVDLLKEADIKVWMVTGDNRDNAVNVAYHTGILNEKLKVYTFNNNEKDEAKRSMRVVLDNLSAILDENPKDIMSKSESDSSLKKLHTNATVHIHNNESNKLNFSIVVEGDTFSHIQQDPYLRSNFAFITALCHSVVGYRFTPKQKADLVSMVRDRFPDEPITLAIGDGLNDALMMREAHVGIELHTREGYLPCYAGDIQIASLKVLKHLLLVNGRNISNKIESIIYYLFYCGCLLTLPIFFYNFFANFTATAIFDSLSVFLYTFWFTLIPIVIYGSFDGGMHPYILTTYPALYIDGKRQKNFRWKQFFISSMAEPIIHTLLIFFIGLFAVSNSLSKDGKTDSLGMSALVMYYSIVVVANIRVYWYYNQKKLLCLMFLVLSMVSLIIWIIVEENAHFVDSNYGNETENIFERGSTLLCLIYLLFACGAVSYMIKHFIYGKFFQTLYDWGSEQDAAQDPFFKNTNILRRAYEPLQLGEIAKSCYKSSEFIDPTIQNLISADAKANEMNFNKFTLKFKGSAGIEQRYRIQVARNSIGLARVIYFFLLIVFGFYILGESLLQAEENETVVNGQETTDSYAFSRLGVFLGFVVVGLILMTEVYRVLYFQITFFCLLAAYTIKVVFDLTDVADIFFGACLMPISTVLVFSISSYQVFILNAIYFIVFCVRVGTTYLADNIDEFEIVSKVPPDEDGAIEGAQVESFGKTYVVISYILYFAFVSLILNVMGYMFEKQRRVEHYASTKLVSQKSNSNELLSLLLPEFVKDKFDTFVGEGTYKDQQDEPIGIMFLGIKEFNEVLKKEGSQVVKILDKVFSHFDKLCKQHGVQKIETVGNSYVACAGLKAAETKLSKTLQATNPIKRLTYLAIDMIQFAESTNITGDQKMKVMVGIHFGKAATGVIGYHKPQFSLIGDAVNTTSRHCFLKMENADHPDKPRLDAANLRLSREAFIELERGGGMGKKVQFEAITNVVFKGKAPTEVYIQRKGDAVGASQKKSGLAGMMGKGGSGGKDLKELLKKAVNTIIDKKREEREFMSKQFKNLLEKAKENKDQVRKYKEQEDNIKDDESDIDDDDEDLELKPNRLFLTLPTTSKSKKKKFSEQTYESNKMLIYTGYLTLFLFYLIQSIMFINIEHTFENRTAFIVLRFIFVFFLGLGFMMLKSFSRKQNGFMYYVVLMYYGICVSFAQSIYTVWETYRNIQVGEAVSILLVLMLCTHSPFLVAPISALFLVVMFFLFFGIEDRDTGDAFTIQNIFFVVAFSLLGLLQAYIYKAYQIKAYNTLQASKKNNARRDFLVTQLLPKHAREKYTVPEESDNGIIDEFKDVFMLYTDIKGFTAFSAGKDPYKVVEALGKLYTRFDELIYNINMANKENPQVYKLYTIGDAYITLSFLDKDIRDIYVEGRNTVKMAMNMRTAIEEVKKEIGYSGLSMRLGIHVGNIVGGVCGTDIVRYDIFGVDSIIANEMESESLEGKINVSEDAKKVFESDPKGCPFEFTEHRVVELKKFGVKVQSYLLELKEGEEID